MTWSLADLLRGPAIPGAACTGRQALFDPPDIGENEDELAYRRAAAVRICRSCPALIACRDAAPEFARAPGARGFVLAGVVITTRRRS